MMETIKEFDEDARFIDDDEDKSWHHKPGTLKPLSFRY